MNEVRESTAQEGVIVEEPLYDWGIENRLDQYYHDPDYQYGYVLPPTAAASKVPEVKQEYPAAAGAASATTYPQIFPGSSQTQQRINPKAMVAVDMDANEILKV